MKISCSRDTRHQRRKNPSTLTERCATSYSRWDLLPSSAGGGAGPRCPSPSGVALVVVPDMLAGVGGAGGCGDGGGSGYGLRSGYGVGLLLGRGALRGVRIVRTLFGWELIRAMEAREGFAAVKSQRHDIGKRTHQENEAEVTRTRPAPEIGFREATNNSALGHEKKFAAAHG